VDINGDPITDGKFYKIRVADGSEISLGWKEKDFVIGLGPTNSGEFYRVQVDTGKGTHWKNGTGQIKLWSRGNKHCWTIATYVPAGNIPRYSLLRPKEDDTKNTVQQWIQGIQDQKGGIWLGMGQFVLKAGQPCRGESYYEEGDYVRIIRCEDRGANVKDYNFECTFIPMPLLN
jgi:hypothetical protein